VRGRAIGVFKGGRLKSFRRWLRVAAKPADIPVEVVVDVTHLETGESLRMKDVMFEKGRLVENPEHRVLMVEIPKVKKEDEEEAAAAAAAPAAGAAAEAPKGEAKNPETK
jgi:large subunit ribosomal protein L25